MMSRRLGGLMVWHKNLKVLALIFFFACGLTGSQLWAEGDAVVFSGKVKKVMVAKNKVAIKDPVSKKRFAVVINQQSKLSGYKGIGDIKKGDMVSGKYVVTDKGLYIATELARK